MALRLRFQFSTDYGALGAGASWTQFADIADSGVPGEVTFSSPTVGVPYWYRVQRYDTNSGLASSWSDAYLYTALVPLGTTAMPENFDPCDIITAADLRFGIAYETFPGVPSKARWIARCTGGYIQRQLSRRYGKVRAGNMARNRSASKGRYTFQGTLNFTFTPERAVPTLIGTAFALTTTTLGGPTRYQHAFANVRSCKTVTIWVQHGADKVACYPGVVASNISFAPAMQSSEVLDVAFQVEATDAFFIQGPTALADSGMNVAVSDLLPEYSQEDFIWAVGGQAAGLRDFSIALDCDLEAIEQRPWHAPIGFRNKSTGLTFEGNSYFKGLDRIASDMGHSATPAGSFGPICSTPLASVSVIANPCAPEGQGFKNTFTFNIPTADVIASEETSDTQGLIDQSVQVNAIYNEAGTLGTDFEFSIVNSQTNAQLTQPGAAVSPGKVPITNSRPYTYDTAGAGASTTVIPLGTTAHPHIDATDGAYVGHQVVIIKASDGTRQTGTVTAYTAPTGVAAGSVTIGTAVAVAPVAGDVVVFL